MSDDLMKAVERARRAARGVYIRLYISNEASDKLKALAAECEKDPRDLGAEIFEKAVVGEEQGCAHQELDV